MKRGIRRAGYPFDVLTRIDGTPAYDEALAFFAAVNPKKDRDLTSRTRKGVLRVKP